MGLLIIWLCLCWRLHEDRLGSLLAGHREVNHSPYTPACGNTERIVRFLPAHACHEFRPDDVKQHAGKVRQGPEYGNEDVLEPVEGFVLEKCHDGHDAGDHV